MDLAKELQYFLEGELFLGIIKVVSSSAPFLYM